MTKNLFDAAYQCIIATDPREKLELTQSVVKAWQLGQLNLNNSGSIQSILMPGLPKKGDVLLIDIQPEEGSTFTAGVVYSPSFGENDFTFIADYWKVELEKGITSLGVSFILDDCYVNQNADACSLITRRSDYSIEKVIDTQLNLSEFVAEGVDVEARWTSDFDFGNLRASLIWTHLLERSQVQFAGEEKNFLKQS